MIFSEEQQRALDKVADWLDGGSSQQVFRLFGCAGTGKTTLAKSLAAKAGNVAFAAYTGKAALVLRQSGCDNATTIHSLIYTPRMKSNARLISLQKSMAKAEKQEKWTDVLQLKNLIEEETANLDRPTFTLNLESELKDVDLLIVDEVSMIDRDVGEDIVSFGTKVLALGDPAQLPPVRGTPFFAAENPDFLLDTIHRQAAESPIIRMATEVRQTGHLISEDYGDCRVVPKGTISIREAAHFDQVLVGRNATRVKFNVAYRNYVMGFGNSHLPVVGDRLVCLRNNHGIGIMNGEQFTVTSMEKIDPDTMLLGLLTLEGKEIEVLSHCHPFEGRDVPIYQRMDAEMFDFGYAMTVHKAQGSEFDRVLLVDESKVFRGNARAWLYTGITRASKHITLVRGSI